MPAADDAPAQGTSDLVMNLAGATAGALSGILVAAIGFSGLSLVAMALVLPATAVVLVKAPPGQVT